MTTQLLLASASPRRRDLIAQLGIKATVCTADIDETPHAHEFPTDYVMRMAQDKNQVVKERLGGFVPILSADTIVVLNQQILQKPKHAIQAQQMLRQLSGQTHYVYTAVCVSYLEQEYHCLQTNTVKFKILSPQEIAYYVATGEPLDKAGAYAIQGLGGVFVQHLSGSFTGVMGLPLYETYQLLKQVGLGVLDDFS